MGDRCHTPETRCYISDVQFLPASTRLRLRWAQGAIKFTELGLDRMKLDLQEQALIADYRCMSDREKHLLSETASACATRRGGARPHLCLVPVSPPGGLLGQRTRAAG